MTDDPNARPSLSERYGVAVSSGTGLEHMILAASMQHERLGAVLLRLQSEYDAGKGNLERAAVSLAKAQHSTTRGKPPRTSWPRRLRPRKAPRSASAASPRRTKKEATRERKTKGTNPRRTKRSPRVASRL